MSPGRNLTREELLAIASQHALGVVAAGELRALMGLPAETTSTIRPLGRTFVCQGCGKAQAVFATRLVCACGTTSTAEIIP